MYGRKRNDKIFDNSYNQGVTDEIYNEPILINTEYKNTYLINEFNSFNVYRLKEISEKMMTLLSVSEEFKPFLDNKSKNIRNRVKDVCEYLLNEFEDTDYTFAEKFYCLCEVLKEKEDFIYTNLPFFYKDKAVKEIFETFPYLKEKKKFNLF